MAGAEISPDRLRPLERLLGLGSARLAMLVVLAAALVGAVAVVGVRSTDGWVALVLAGVLAGIGLVALVAGAAGLLHFGANRHDRIHAMVADTSGTGVLVADRQGRVEYANATYNSLLGIGDTSPRTPDLLFAENRDLAEALFRLSGAARRGEPWSEEVRLVPTSDTPPNPPRWLKISVSAETSGADTWTVWRVVDLADISERQEVTFRELQQIINYLDHAPVGFFSALGDGRLSYLNATLAEWLGLNLDKTTGGLLQIDEIATSEAKALLCDIAPLLSGTRVETFETDLTRADGARLPVTIVHRVGFDADGTPQPSRSIVLRRDNPKEAAYDLSADARFVRFFNSAPIGIAMLDTGGTIDRANPEFTRIFDRPGLRGKAFIDLVNEDHRPAVVAALSRARLGQVEAAPMEIGLVETKICQVYVSSVEATTGPGATVLVYVIDLTEQRNLEEQFSQSQKMQAIGQLAGGVAHDFNNVLTAIIGFSDLLLANHRPTDPAFQDIMNIRQNANRAAGLVRQLLAFSRQQTMRAEVLSLSDVIADVTVMLRRILGERTELTVKNGRDLWQISADRNQFDQVVMNLVVNARDAMPEGGTVTVATSNVGAGSVAALGHTVMPSADYVRVDVSDTGTGIPKENLEKIFEPFFSTKEVGKGTGLGLSMVYGIIKQSGGFIFTDSTVGEGTCFSIYFPRHIPSPEEEEANAASAEQASAKPAKEKTERADLTGKGAILLVEDEDAVRAFATRALEARGYTVTAAQSGVHALELVDAMDGPLDLVISDVVMPEMDGPTLLKELRARDLECKIIFISGYAEEAFRKSLDKKEPFAFLPKPFSLKQLAQKVKEVLEGE
ncbi:MAG: cell cycle histidine kinase CckA [Alphaproteobacteria bacterium]